MTKHSPNILSNTTVFLFCQAPTGEGITIADVRNWLEKVDALNLPEDTELEGAIFLNFDFEDVAVSRIDCGNCIPDCNHKDVLIEIPHAPIQ